MLLLLNVESAIFCKPPPRGEPTIRIVDPGAWGAGKRVLEKWISKNKLPFGPKRCKPPRPLMLLISFPPAF